MQAATETAKLLSSFGVYGPLGLMVVMLFVLLLMQKKENKELRKEGAEALQKERQNSIDLSKSLESLSRESIKADIEHTAAQEAHTKVLESIDRRLSL